MPVSRHMFYLNYLSSTSSYQSVSIGTYQDLSSTFSPTVLEVFISSIHQNS